jgi:hypothetical protein
MEALEFINIICPEHSRTSCSDENISNGFYSSPGWQGRCLRCVYLEIASGVKLPEKFNPEHL